MNLKTFLVALAITSSALAQSVEWSYSYPARPSQWGTLPGFSACALGAQQSPIAIETGVIPGTPNVQEASDLPQIRPQIEDAHTLATFNGHSVQASLSGSPLSFRGHDFAAVQFHFHSPSEHMLNGRQYPLEAHFVHKGPEGALLVLGVFFEEGQSNLALEETWRSLEETSGTPVRIPVMDFFPRDLSDFTYQGSLTTPPCTEGVTWVVLRSPVEASRAQLRVLQKITGGPNNRPVQSLKSRAVFTESLP